MNSLRANGHVVPITIVRELLRRLKARWRRVQGRLRAKQRQHITVKGRDVLWSQDATHLGRDEDGKIEGLMVKDVGTASAIQQSIGGPVQATDVVSILEHARRSRGALPLVVAMDNGPANRAPKVLRYLSRERVIALWNQPHTPEHNAWVESLHGEVKRELAACGELVPDPGGVTVTKGFLSERLARLLPLLNGRLRRTRGGASAAQLDRSLPRAEDLVSRAHFYDTVRAAIRAAVLSVNTARARRRAEREAILCTLEGLGLVTRTRGPLANTCSKAVRLS